MWPGLVAPLKHLKVLKLLNNMHANTIFREAPSDFCCLTIRKFREQKFEVLRISVSYLLSIRNIIQQ